MHSANFPGRLEQNKTTNILLQPAISMLTDLGCVFKLHEARSSRPIPSPRKDRDVDLPCLQDTPWYCTFCEHEPHPLQSCTAGRWGTTSHLAVYHSRIFYVPILFSFNVSQMRMRFSDESSLVSSPDHMIGVPLSCPIPGVKLG